MPKTIPHKLTQIDVFIGDARDKIEIRVTRHVAQYQEYVTWHKRSKTTLNFLSLYVKFFFAFGKCEKRTLMSGDRMYTWRLI